MKQWLSVNQRTIAAFLTALAMIALVHFWPELKQDQQVIHLFVELLLAVAMVIFPNLRPSKRKDDE